MHDHMPNPGWGVARVVGLTVVGIIGAVIIAFLFGYFVMLLWNWLLPPLFHVGTINYWQAFGLVILAKIFFGGVGGGHHHGHGRRDWRRNARHWERCGKTHDHDWKGPWRWEEGDEWAPKGSSSNWRYYGRYWKDEGKSAFEAYLDKLEKDKPKDSGPADEKK